MVGGAIMQKFDEASFLPLLSREEILEKLEISRMQAANGQVQDFEEALDEICRELDI